MPSLPSHKYREALRKGKSIDQAIREHEREQEEKATEEDESTPPSGDSVSEDPTGEPPPTAAVQANMGLERTRHVREVLTKIFEVNPVGKPRQTQQDKWKERPCVMRYRRFADAVRAQAGAWSVPEHGFHLVFHVEAPKTKQERDGEPHHLKPDIDNLTKAFFDALEDEDKYIWDVRATARWCKTGDGCIQVFTINEVDSLG